MKKVLLLLSLLFLKTVVFAQEQSEIFVRTSFNVVQDYTFEPARALGFGTHVGYRPNFEWKQLRPYFLLGFESNTPSINRNNELYWWHQKNFRFQAGMERQVIETGKEKFWIGLGGSLTRGRLVSGFTRQTVNGIVVFESVSRRIDSESSAQLSFRYQNVSFSEVMSFGYTMDYFFSGVILHGLAINWRIW